MSRVTYGMHRSQSSLGASHIDEWNTESSVCVIVRICTFSLSLSLSLSLSIFHIHLQLNTYTRKCTVLSFFQTPSAMHLRAASTLCIPSMTPYVWSCHRSSSSGSLNSTTSMKLVVSQPLSFILLYKSFTPSGFTARISENVCNIDGLITTGVG